LRYLCAAGNDARVITAGEFKSVYASGRVSGGADEGGEVNPRTAIHWLSL